jgi:hypothetical protein
MLVMAYMEATWRVGFTPLNKQREEESIEFGGINVDIGDFAGQARLLLNLVGRGLVFLFHLYGIES